MRAEADGHIRQRVGITSLERIVMINIYITVISLVVWYVFFAGPPSPLGCPRARRADGASARTVAKSGSKQAVSIGGASRSRRCG
jgi:hypothetical protein